MAKPNSVLGLDPSIRSTGVSNGKEHILIKTKPSDLETLYGNLLRRCQEIVAKLVIFIKKNYSPEDEILLVVEGAALSPGANHLFEMGWLYDEIHTRLPAMLDQKLHIIQVPPTVMKKWISGKGNTPKENLPAIVKEKYGVEFELDKGGDKCDAFILYKMGVALLEGAYQYTPSPRRGKGGKKKAKDESKTQTKTRQVRKTPTPKKRSSKSVSGNAGSSDKPVRRGRKYSSSA